MKCLQESQFGFPIFGGLLQLKFLVKWWHIIHGLKAYLKTFLTICRTPSNSKGIKIYKGSYEKYPTINIRNPNAPVKEPKKSTVEP